MKYIKWLLVFLYNLTGVIVWDLPLMILVFLLTHALRFVIWLKKDNLLLSFIIVILMSGIANAPTMPYYYVKVRILAYSVKQPKEGYKNALGKSARNEIGASCHKSFLPLGTIVEYQGDRRMIDDRTPYKAVKIIGTNRIIELRWYQSIKSKPKTKNVNKELRKKFDKGWDYIKIYYKEINSKTFK